MMNSETLAVVYGLCSAIAWGAGDFSGGVASRRNSVLMVVFFSQAVGMLMLTLMAVVLAEKAPQREHLILGGLAGIFGGFGLIALYRGLSTGRMGVVAPLSAVLTAVIPVIFSFFIEGVPKISQLFGFGLAVISVWLLSSGRPFGKIHIRELYLPLCAGLGFGLFFIFIDRVSEIAILWPLVAARCASIILIALLAVIRRDIRVPPKNQFAFIALAGLFDTAGNVFFALASWLGRLDVSALLASMYPAATVVLAWIILRERLHSRQWVGVLAAVSALIFIAG